MDSFDALVDALKNNTPLARRFTRAVSVNVELDGTYSYTYALGYRRVHPKGDKSGWWRYDAMVICKNKHFGYIKLHHRMTLAELLSDFDTLYPIVKLKLFEIDNDNPDISRRVMVRLRQLKYGVSRDNENVYNGRKGRQYSLRSLETLNRYFGKGQCLL